MSDAAGVARAEVDFLLTESRRPLVLFECKLAEDRPDEALEYFGEQLGGVPRPQLVGTEGIDRKLRGTRVVSAARLLGALP